MKGVVLAGGLGTRMGLLTKRAINKHIFPVYDGEFCKPMIFYPINTLVNAGITEICIVTGGNRFGGDIVNIVGDGKEHGIDYLTYEFQFGEKGIADALSKVRRFVDGDNCCVILGDNYFELFDLKTIVKNFQLGAHLFLKKVKDPDRFGVARLDPHNEHVNEIHEKPKEFISDLAVAGLYIYDSRVFNYIEQTKPSGRGELEITDVNNLYIRDTKVTHTILDTLWSDMGTPESISDVCSFLRVKK